MRISIARLVPLFVLLCVAAAPGARAEVPFIAETLTVGMPYGEAVFPLRHPNRTPNWFFQPVLYFTDSAGATKAETRRVEQLGQAGAWAVLVDLKKLQAGLADEAAFAAALDALAKAVQGRMSEAMGPRLKGMPERIWPITFAGSGAGAVRAVDAAIVYKALGGVRGILLFSPADQAPSLDRGGAPRVLGDLVPKLGVTPVAFVAPAEDTRLHALSAKIIGYSGVQKTPSEGLSFLSMFYQIRHRRDPSKVPPAPKPEDLFQPNPRLGH